MKIARYVLFCFLNGTSLYTEIKVTNLFTFTRKALEYPPGSFKVATKSWDLLLAGLWLHVSINSKNSLHSTWSESLDTWIMICFAIFLRTSRLCLQILFTSIWYAFVKWWHEIFSLAKFWNVNNPSKNSQPQLIPFKLGQTSLLTKCSCKWQTKSITRK